MGLQYSSSFVSMTAVTAFPTEDADFPKSRLVNSEFPLREARSTALADQYYVLDHGSDLDNEEYGIAVFNANAVTVKFAHGESATYNDASFTPETTHTLALDRLVSRYKGFFLKTMGGANKRYLRYLIPNQTPTDGTSVLASAYVAVVSDVVTCAYGPVVTIPATRRQQMLGERVARSAPWLEMDWSWPQLSGTELEKVQDLAALGEDQIFVGFLNRGNNQDVYLLRRIGEPSYGMSPQGKMSVSFRVREWIGPVE